MKRWWIAVVALLLLGTGYLFLRGARGEERAATALAQETVVVERGNLRTTIEASGSVVAAEEVSLSFGAGGKVAEVLVEVGDQVEASQPLVRLETDDEEEAVRQAEIALAEARLDLQEVLDGASEEEIASAEADLRGAQADYAGVVGGTTEAEIAKAQAALEQAEAGLASAQSNYDRFAGYRPNVDPEYSAVAEPLWAAQAAYDRALASYNATVDGATDNERWSAWTRVQLAQAGLDRLLEQPTDEAVRLAEIALTQAEIDLAQAEHDLAEATLMAPIAGTVTAVYVEEGEMTSGTALVIGTLDTLVVDLVLDEADVVQIEAGQPAVVTLDALDDGELLGRITYIAPTADIQSGVVLFAVTVTLDPTDEVVRAGMTADVEIVTADVEDVLLVPVKAVQEVNGRTIVLRKSVEGEGRRSGRGNFVPVPVETGLTTETQVEILSGLEEGEEIVVVNTARVMEETEERPPFGFGGPGMPGAAP